jgi:hypothetical protein
MTGGRANERLWKMELADLDEVELALLLKLVAEEASRRELPEVRQLFEVERAWVKKRLGCA